jgi:hypothetical protein
MRGGGVAPIILNRTEVGMIGYFKVLTSLLRENSVKFGGATNLTCIPSCNICILAVSANVK